MTKLNVVESSGKNASKCSLELRISFGVKAFIRLTLMYKPEIKPLVHSVYHISASPCCVVTLYGDAHQATAKAQRRCINRPGYFSLPETCIHIR